VTLALCGDWEHEPPCALAPHHTSAQRHDGVLDLRVVFITEAIHEPEVRARIAAALQRGRLDEFRGRTGQWELLCQSAGTLSAAEADLADRMAATT
jgi:hypothetical protein